MPPSSADPAPNSPAEAPTPLKRVWYLNPYVQMSLSIALSASAHILLKRGAQDHVSADAWFAIDGLRSGWVWLGILAMVSSLGSWLYALRFVPLNIAFNLAGVIHAIVPLGGCLFFHETIGLQRGIGIGLVVAGVMVIAQIAGEAEEKL